MKLSKSEIEELQQHATTIFRLSRVRCGAIPRTIYFSLRPFPACIRIRSAFKRIKPSASF